MNNQNKEEQRQLWIARICEIEDSGLSQEEWCKSREIPYSTLRYWVSKLRREVKTEGQQTNWLKIDTYPGKDIATLRIPEDKGMMNGINIHFGAFTVELQNECNPQRIIDVLRILKEL